MSTDLVLENQLLQQRLAALHGTLDNIGSYIYTKDINGCYTYANKLVQEFFQLPLTEIIGKDDSYFFSLDLCNELKTNDKQVLVHGKTVEKEEKNIIARTGEARYYWAVKQPIYDNKGKVIGLSGISTDITERKLLAEQLAAKQQLLDTILDNVDAYVYMKDNQRRFLYINQKTAELFQCQPNDVLGKTDKELMGVEHDFEDMDQQVLTTGRAVTGEEVFHDEAGNAHYYWSNKVPLLNDKQEVSSYIGFSHEITELIKLKQELEQKATTDDLTKLTNRRHLLEQAEVALKQSIRPNYPLSVLIVDLDHFKRINDNYGHLVGDQVLIKVADCIRANIRSNDFAGRLGGEEFCLVLPDTNGQQALVIAERLRADIAQLAIEPLHQFTANKNKPLQALSLTASIGVAQAEANNQEIKNTLQHADDALYQAKAAGRNRVVVYRQ